MEEIIEQYLPNVIKYLPEFYEAIEETLIMLAWSGSISFILGLIIGLILTVTRKGQILENTFIYNILDKLISLFRSIPFIILLTWLMPLSRSIMGTAIGVDGAIVPLIFGCVPFFSRQVESPYLKLTLGLSKQLRRWAVHLGRLSLRFTCVNLYQA